MVLSITVVGAGVGTQAEIMPTNAKMMIKFFDFILIIFINKYKKVF